MGSNLSHAIRILDSKKSVANPFCFLLMIFFLKKKTIFLSLLLSQKVVNQVE